MPPLPDQIQQRPGHPHIGTGHSQVFYQRFDNSGLIDPPVLVSVPSAFPTDDLFNDISGDLIVYTAFVSSTLGQIKMFEISTGSTFTVSGLTQVGEARIHGTNVVWVEGVLGAETIFLCDLTNFGGASHPITIAGSTPAATAVEIGDTFIVWESAGVNRPGFSGDCFS